MSGAWTLHEVEAWRLYYGFWQNSPAPSGACFMQIPASESLLFLFSLTEGANSCQIWRSGQNHVLVIEWAWFNSGISVLSGEATLLRSSGMIPCACSKL